MKQERERKGMKEDHVNEKREKITEVKGKQKKWKKQSK
jgi:hypothetical protein